jgi:hypothetical protein
MTFGVALDPQKKIISFQRHPFTMGRMRREKKAAVTVIFLALPTMTGIKQLVHMLL